jgi:hypothetical protein
VGGGRRVVYVASGSASSRFSASELLWMAAGSRGLWGLDFVGLDFFSFLDPGDVVSLDYFLSERS